MGRSRKRIGDKGQKTQLSHDGNPQDYSSNMSGKSGQTDSLQESTTHSSQSDDQLRIL